MDMAALALGNGSETAVEKLLGGVADY